MRHFCSLALCLGLLAVPVQGRGECPLDPADRAFAHPYGEPPACPETSSPKEVPPEALRDEGRGRPVRSLGLAGMAAGTTFAGLGGTSLLSAYLSEDGSKTQKVFRGMGLGMLVAGGTLFLAGAVLVAADALQAPVPAPTPDGRGAQLSFALRF
jgi:hypothetical protein